jgi:hypothetical protein
LKRKLIVILTVTVLTLGAAGISGCRRDVKLPATPTRTNRQLLPSVGGSPLATPGAALSPLDK